MAQTMTGQCGGEGRSQEAFEVLFTSPEPSGGLRLADSRLLPLIRGVLAGGSAEASPGRAGVADYLNALSRLGAPEWIADQFCGELFEALIRQRIPAEELRQGKISEDAAFLLRHALHLCGELRGAEARLAERQRQRTLPGARAILSGLPDPDLPPGELAVLLAKRDPFAASRAFCYRRGVFVAVKPDSVKPVSRFFGFPGVRAAFADHFADFASGRSNLPLLINSLPGYGKTSMTISYALAAPDLTVILPEPEALEENWRELMSHLAQRPDRRFAVFFDDIDPRKVDWYSFRTNVGGAFAPPENVMPVLAANYEFPATILSRGRKITYPVFDELRCTEMVEDFLRSCGMNHPPINLVSVIGADYTEQFGQKKFTELSPRTLMRYLATYSDNPGKRRTMVELANGELITHPDAELFYEFNVELMRSLYGEEYIKRLLKERLKEL